MRVLVVDDDDITLEMMVSAILRKRGYEVDTASDGHEAMSILAARAHRIVISDWEMPGMNGPELCKAIRRTDYGCLYLRDPAQRPE